MGPAVATAYPGDTAGPLPRGQVTDPVDEQARPDPCRPCSLLAMTDHDGVVAGHRNTATGTALVSKGGPVAEQAAGLVTSDVPHEPGGAYLRLDGLEVGVGRSRTAAPAATALPWSAHVAGL